MRTRAGGDGRKTEGYAKQNKHKCRLIHVTESTDDQFVLERTPKGFRWGKVCVFS